jgi:hypothetical protein
MVLALPGQKYFSIKCSCKSLAVLLFSHPNMLPGQGSDGNKQHQDGQLHQHSFCKQCGLGLLKTLKVGNEQGEQEGHYLRSNELQ